MQLLLRCRILLVLLLVFSTGHAVFSQCQVYDGQGNLNANPIWVSCTGSDFTLFIQSNLAFANTTIDWGDGSPLTTMASIIPPAFVSHTYTAAIANYNVMITDTANNCVINGLVVMEEPVNASLQIPIGGVTTTCAPDDLVFTNSSTDVSPNTTFTWDFGDGTPILTFGDTNSGQTITHAYQQNTVNCVTQVTLTAENYCSFGNPTVATFNPIQIYDIDVAEIAADFQLLCYPDTVVHFDNITNKNCVPQGNTAQRFEYWNFGNYWGTGHDSIIDWQPFDPPAKPGYDIAFPGIGVYTIMMADSNQCGTDTAFITVQIVPPPTADFIVNKDSACEGETIVFTNLSTGGANQFLVDYGEGNGFQGAGAGSFNHSYNTAGTYQVTFVANIVGGTASCTDTAMLNIEVLPTPVVNLALSNATACDSSLVGFTNTSTGGTSYLWDFGNGDTSTLQSPPSLLYDNTGSYTVSLLVTSDDGCSNQATATVNIYDTPNTQFVSQNVCEDELAQFIDSSSVGFGGPINSWTWTFGDPLNSTSSLQNTTFTYVDSGEYVITLISATSFCADTLSDTLIIEPRPTALFTKSDSVGCAPLNIGFTNQSVNGATYFWDFGDGSTSTLVNPSHSFTNSSLSDTLYIVKLITTSAFGCTDSVFDTVQVLGNPQAIFSSTAVLDCAPLMVSFTDASLGAVSWLWDFGDSSGSVLQNPSNIFENQTQFITNYQTQLIVTAANGCTDTAYETITVYPEPLFNFGIVPDSGCSPLNVQFPVAVGAVLYSWDFGDGTTSTGPNPSHTFTNTTTNNQVYNVQLVATSAFGCIDTVNGDVTVFPNPTASLSPVISQGCQPLTVNLLNSSIGGSTYDWDLGDGTVSNTNNTALAHTYSNLTNDTLFYAPSLIVTTDKGCADTATVMVNVYRYVEANFSVPPEGCHPFAVQFIDSALNAHSYAWDFDDGSNDTASNPAHTYMNTTSLPQVYQPTLTVTTIEGCSDDTSFNVTVNPKPNAQITPLNASGCQPLLATFNNNSTGATSYLWDFDDGDSATAAGAQSHTYPNLTNDTLFYQPTLFASNTYGCHDTVTSSIQVFKYIEANYTALDSGCHPLAVGFQDASINAVVYNWDFDDGNASLLQNPNHVYQNLGLTPLIYNSELTVFSVEGCQDDTSLSITVNPKPTSTILPLNAAGCQPLSVTFSNNSSGATSYLWDFGDGDSTMASGGVTQVYENLGNDTAFFAPVLYAFNDFGCSDTANAQIQVYRFVEASFTGPFDGCHPLFVNFSSTSTNASTWNWDFGNGFTSSGPNAIHSYSNSGTASLSYNATLTVQNIEGCVDDTVQSISVFPSPVAGFTISENTLCHDANASIVNSSIGADDNFWQYGSSGAVLNNFSVLDTSFFNFSSTPNNFNITLITQNNFGCNDTFEQGVTVYPIVEAEISAINEGCGPLEIDFNNLSFGGSLFQWDFGDGDISFFEEPTHTFQNTGSSASIFPVILTVTSPFGCTDIDTLEVTVHPDPQTSFSATPPVQMYPSTSISVINTTPGTWDYLWEFGDGVSHNLVNPINHVYDTWGTYVITLTASGEFCEDTAMRTIRITPPLPSADFVIDTQGCAPVRIQLTSTSEYAETFFWSFGDGATSSAENPSYTYQFAGEYDISLIVRGPGGDTASKSIRAAVEVFPSPIANFVFNPNEVTLPNEPVTFVNYSQFAETYLWNFGDSNISEERNPQHLYSQVGEFIPWLVVYSDGGCSDTMVSQLPVKAIQDGTIEIPNAFTPNTQSGNGGAYDPFATDNQVFFPIVTGLAQDDYILSIFNRWGELLFETTELGVGWDGYYRGKLCQQDVYVWKIRGRYITGEEFYEVGDVTLLR